jgi:RecJ-like exonuclease
MTTLANEMYQCYENLYDSIDDLQWNVFAEKYSTSVVIMKEIFSVKEDEHESLVDFIEEWISEYPLLQDVLNATNGQLINEEYIQYIFFKAIDNLVESEGIESLQEDEILWTCVISEAILTALFDSIMEKLEN